LPDEDTYAVRVFSRGDFGLGGAVYRCTTPPNPGDEVDVRRLHGVPDAYRRTKPGKVRVVGVGEERRVIEAHGLD
jgi:hypothetical protein